MKNIDNKLSSLKYNKDAESHLSVDNDICMRCETKECEKICPANVYQWNDTEKEMLIRYENCLECGACRIICNKQNICWKYPNPDFGVSYKNG